MDSIHAGRKYSEGMDDLCMFHMCRIGCDQFMTNTVCHICASSFLDKSSTHSEI